MLAFRQIIDDPDEVVPVPSELRHHRTEVIFLALDAWPESVHPQPTLASLAGCWEGDEDEFRRVPGLVVEDWE